MLEMGANTVRLAHYQHAQYFYDLCDEAGMIVWAEIPYITRHMEPGNANTISQMTELIVQNYNHPSIICWGLSNEITAAGGVTEEMVANHRVLNDLCHKMDATRPTTMAHAFMLDPNDDFVFLSDIRSYNLYFVGTSGRRSRTTPGSMISMRLIPTRSSASPSSERTPIRHTSPRSREGGLDRELSGGLSRAYACHVEGAPLHLGHACVEYVRLCGRRKK